MKHNYRRWSEEERRYLRQHYEQMPNDDILNGLRAIGWVGNYRTMVAYANRMLGLKKVNRQARIQKRRNTIAREMLRARLDMYPITKVQNLGHAEHQNLKNARSYLKRKRGYICKRFDHNIYYDENTRRSDRIEARIKKLGVQIRPITSQQ